MVEESRGLRSEACSLEELSSQESSRGGGGTDSLLKRPPVRKWGTRYGVAPAEENVWRREGGSQLFGCGRAEKR